ncbi:PP2C family serine/threonine-protein phosphatase [Actinoplanes missouriensis]|uniref:PP2C family protein-serine/threonine phosphatase n=1 Tax=Actinoplanes missouriensis TaxID=1866 RepID=UPI003401738B
MIVVDCAACGDERDAGAAFCEACGRALEIGGSAPSGAGEDGGRLGAGDDPDPSSARRRACPHCRAARAVGADGYCEECGMLAGRPRDHIEADGGAAAAAVSDRGRRHHRNEDAMWLAVGDAAADVVVCDGVSASFDPDAASDIAARTAGELLAAAQHPEDEVAGGASGDGLAALLSPGDKPGISGAGEPDGSEGPAHSEGSAREGAKDAVNAVDAVDARPDADEGGSDGDATPAVAIAGVVAAAIAGAAEAVVSLAHTGDPRRAVSNPACTIVAAAVRGPHVGFGWVGDSRAYWLNADGPAEQLTEDDSWAAHMVKLGADPIEAMDDPRAHAITAWLGADAGPIMPRVGAFTATHDGLLVLCSDGLWNYLPDPEAFAATVRDCTAGRSLLEAARALVSFANRAGGADNITVALVPVHATAPPAAGRPSAGSPAAGPDPTDSPADSPAVEDN